LNSQKGSKERTIEKGWVGGRASLKLLGIAVILDRRDEEHLLSGQCSSSAAEERNYLST
jgi:hypothetical protein